MDIQIAEYTTSSIGKVTGFTKEDSFVKTQYTLDRYLIDKTDDLPEEPSPCFPHRQENHIPTNVFQTVQETSMDCDKSNVFADFSSFLNRFPQD